MKTRLHHYSFNISRDDDRKEYLELVHTIEANGIEGRGRQLKSISTERFNFEKAGITEEVELDSTYLFDNQWNEAEKSGNRRLFDWWEEAIFISGRENRNIKRGHWLEITAEMTEARQTTLKCGYCGKLYGPLHDDRPEGGYCLSCLDSPYLKETDLHLLKLLPLVGLQTREKLTEEETGRLLPLYLERQTTGRDSRAKQKRDKQREKVLNEYQKDIENAEIEKTGMIWLWEQGFNLENVIYYSHTRKFCFGWRNPVSESVKSKILDVISEFPYNYEIKTTSSKLEG